MRVPTMLALAAGTLGLAAPSQAATLKTLYSFCSQASCADGRGPYDSVTMSADGTLYGVTQFGGLQQDVGTVYALVPNAQKTQWTFEQLYKFCSMSMCKDGQWPVGKLIQDGKGNLYGVASGGGAGSGGTIFELQHKRDTWKFKLLHSFCAEADCADGKTPVSGLSYAGEASGLAYDGTSPLYGTASGGGVNDQGTAFSLVKDGGKWKEKVLSTFDSTTFYPNGPITIDANNNLFVTTLAPFLTGAAVEISPKNHKLKKWSMHVIYSFTGSNDGSQPRSDMIMDDQGRLFGTTAEGGTVGSPHGVVFRMTPDGPTDWSASVTHEFCEQSDCADGASPWGGVALDASGNLVGTTTGGGGHDSDTFSSGGGIIFRADREGDSFQKLYAFCALTACADGEYPYSKPILDASGNIFGTTTDAGANGHGGTVYELVP